MSGSDRLPEGNLSSVSGKIEGTAPTSKLTILNSSSSLSTNQATDGSLFGRVTQPDISPGVHPFASSANSSVDSGGSNAAINTGGDFSNRSMAPSVPSDTKISTVDTGKSGGQAASQSGRANQGVDAGPTQKAQSRAAKNSKPDNTSTRRDDGPCVTCAAERFETTDVTAEKRAELMQWEKFRTGLEAASAAYQPPETRVAPAGYRNANAEDLKSLGLEQDMLSILLIRAGRQSFARPSSSIRKREMRLSLLRERRPGRNGQPLGVRIFWVRM